jgi:hypothetical protein
MAAYPWQEVSRMAHQALDEWLEGLKPLLEQAEVPTLRDPCPPADRLDIPLHVAEAGGCPHAHTSSRPSKCFP